MDYGFNQYPDVYSELRKHLRLPRTIEGATAGYKEFTDEFITRAPNEQVTVGLHQADTELNWYKAGQPYFKIFPGMIGAMSHIGLGIDCSLLRSLYPAFEIRFPQRDNPMREAPDKPELLSALVGITNTGVKDEKLLSIWCDFGEKINNFVPPGEFNEPVLTFIRFYMIPGMTIDEAFEKRPPDMPDIGGYYPSTEFQKSILRLAIAVMFFSVDEHEIVAPDIPRKLLDKYASARRAGNRGEMKSIVQKARKKLQLPGFSSGGFVIGREIDLPRRAKDYSEARPKDGEKHWEISYGYVRSPHIRMQPFGPKDSPKVKAILISAHPVREDLPMKRPGYNIGRQ